MVDIQPATAENRRGKKRRKKKIETTATKYNGLPITMDGHNEFMWVAKSVALSAFCVTCILHLFIWQLPAVDSRLQMI